jgi:predicted RNA-binding Zn ribbon-like protein
MPQIDERVKPDLSCRVASSDHGTALPTAPFYFGERLCLDLANTRSWRPGPAPTERLRAFSDLLRWAGLAGALPPQECDALRGEARRRPRAAGRAFARAIRLREAIYRMFAALARGKAPAPEDLAILNAELARALRHVALGKGETGYALQWRQAQPRLESVLWPVAWSAAEVLARDDLRLVRMCAAPDCGWLFLDTTPNCRRRWCDMRVCGNRAKARAYYARRTGARPGGSRQSTG